MCYLYVNIPVEEQEWECSGKALVQLARGETRSCENLELVLTEIPGFLLLGMGRTRENWESWLSAWNVSVCSTSTADPRC